MDILHTHRGCQNDHGDCSCLDGLWGDPGVEKVKIITQETNFVNNMKTVYRESEDRFPAWTERESTEED